LKKTLSRKDKEAVYYEPSCLTKSRKMYFHVTKM